MFGDGAARLARTVVGEHHSELAIPVWSMTVIVLAAVAVGAAIAWRQCSGEVPVVAPEDVSPLTIAARRDLYGDALNENLLIVPVSSSPLPLSRLRIRASATYRGPLDTASDHCRHACAAGRTASSDRMHCPRLPVRQSFSRQLWWWCGDGLAHCSLARTRGRRRRCRRHTVVAGRGREMGGPGRGDDHAGIAGGLAAAFDTSPSAPRYQFTENHSWIPTFGAGYDLGLDGIGLVMVLLTAALLPFSSSPPGATQIR